MQAQAAFKEQLCDPERVIQKLPKAAALLQSCSPYGRFASQAPCINKSTAHGEQLPSHSLSPASLLTRSAHSARSKIQLLRKSQQFQGKQLPAKSFNGRRGNESPASLGSRLQMPPCSGPHLFVPSSTGGAEGADHSSPSLEYGGRSQGHKQPVRVCLEPGNLQAPPVPSNQKVLLMCFGKHHQAPL